MTFTHAGESKTVSVARGYNAQTVYYSASGNVGTVKITNFYGTTPEQLRGALKYMSENAVTSIIFDVRNNAGGLVRYAAECIDILAPVAAEVRAQSPLRSIMTERLLRPLPPTPTA